MKGDDIMAVIAKPRTGAFVLDDKKAKNFFKQTEHTADKAIARVMVHRAKAGMVDSCKDGKNL